MRELAQRLRQRRQLVAGEIQRLQLRELAQPLWQKRQSVVGELQLPQLRELAQRLRQLGEFPLLLIVQAAEIEFLRPRPPRSFNLQFRYSTSFVSCHSL